MRVNRLASDGVSPDELRRGQGQLSGGIVLSLEDSGSRMSRIAKAELLYDELPSIDEVLRRISAVTPSSCMFSNEPHPRSTCVATSRPIPNG